MAAYVVVEVNVTDPQQFGEYAKGVPATIAAYGGIPGSSLVEIDCIAAR